MGTSLGGFLAARAAAFEHRLAALILHDAIFDIRSGLRSLPPELLGLGAHNSNGDRAGADGGLATRLGGGGRRSCLDHATALLGVCSW
jgi:hypothetical protein